MIFVLIMLLIRTPLKLKHRNIETRINYYSYRRQEQGRLKVYSTKRNRTLKIVPACVSPDSHGTRVGEETGEGGDAAIGTGSLADHAQRRRRTTRTCKLVQIARRQQPPSETPARDGPLLLPVGCCCVNSVASTLRDEPYHFDQSYIDSGSTEIFPSACPRACPICVRTFLYNTRSII